MRDVKVQFRSGGGKNASSASIVATDGDGSLGSANRKKQSPQECNLVLRPVSNDDTLGAEESCGGNVMRKMSSLALPQLKFRTRFWKKRTVTISDLDPTFRVTYLGNVLTGWAKGEGCLDKPLSTLWRNHVGSEKPHIVMKVTIAASGLKAVTKEHGLTEYWAHRITYCAADPNYPKVFCWIYRHEGRKMKQELRCHAVLCPSESKAKAMAEKLQSRLHQALIDFRKEKLSRQNARLSLANHIYENPTMPNRKIMLHTGSSNYRPPNDRGKSAPKLKVIEEVILEEEEEEEEEEVEEEEDEEPLMALCRSTSAPVGSAFDSNLQGEDMPSFQPMNIEDNLMRNNDRLLFEEEEDEEEEDEVTNYLPGNNNNNSNSNPDSAASVSPDSNAFSTRSSSISRQQQDSEEEEEEEEVVVLGALKLSEQDAISDESGYSEDSSNNINVVVAATTKMQKDELLSGKTTVVNLTEEKEDNVDSTVQCDLTVHSAMIADFSSTERLRYLDKLQLQHLRRPAAAEDRDFLMRGGGGGGAGGNRITEFCINI